VASRRRAGRASAAPRRGSRSTAPQPPIDLAGDTGHGLAARAALVALGIATAGIVLYARFRLAGTPLERDEGEYAYAGQLILQGIPPYALVYNMKFPGVYYAYAAIMGVLGETPWAIRVGLLAVHAATAAALFVLCRRLAGSLVGVVAACTFALLALDRWSMGVFAHATHFVALPAVASLLALHQAVASERARWFVAAGALAGLAVVMKQQAAALALLTIGLATWTGRRHGAMAIAGSAIPIVLLVALLAIEGVLGRFWFWTFQYAAAYVSETPLSAAAAMFGFAWTYITQDNAVIWYGAAAGLALLFLARWSARLRVAAVVWLGAAALAVAPGFFFRPHYFILAMPVAGLLTGIGVASIERGLTGALGAARARLAAVALFAALAGVYVWGEADYLFRMTPAAVSRAVYESNPFIESVEIGRYLQAHTSPDDRIAVLGSEPQIYFYADRKSATGYIYTYALMERQPYAARMQDEMRREIEAARPAYLVFVGIAASWAAQPSSDQRILTWANEYTAKCYERVGVADIDPRRGTTMRWDADSAGYQTRSPFVVLTFRRAAREGC
jgi:hypothetical protein